MSTNDQPNASAHLEGGGSYGAALDVNVLSMLRDLSGPEDEEDFLTELIDVYLSTIPGLITALNEGVSQGDAKLVERVAHRMKGSSGNLGAQAMFNLCASIEKNARSGDLVAAGRLAEQLSGEFERVKGPLETQWRIDAGDSRRAGASRD